MREHRGDRGLLPGQPALRRGGGPRRALSWLAVLALLGACQSAPAKRSAPQQQPVLAPAAEILEAIRAPGARVVLVNVWSSWCDPCVHELPALAKLRARYAGEGLRLVLISADAPGEAAEARATLKKLGIDFPSFLHAGGDQALIDALAPKGRGAQWSGTLPASFVFTPDGALTHFQEEEASYADFEAWVRPLLAL